MQQGAVGAGEEDLGDPVGVDVLDPGPPLDLPPGVEPGDGSPGAPSAKQAAVTSPRRLRARPAQGSRQAAGTPSRKATATSRPRAVSAAASRIAAMHPTSSPTNSCVVSSEK